MIDSISKIIETLSKDPDALPFIMISSSAVLAASYAYYQLGIVNPRRLDELEAKLNSKDTF